MTESEYKNIKLGSEGQDAKFFTLDETLGLPMVPKFKVFIKRNINVLKDIIENDSSVNASKFSLVTNRF